MGVSVSRSVGATWTLVSSGAEVVDCCLVPVEVATTIIMRAKIAKPMIIHRVFLLFIGS